MKKCIILTMDDISAFEVYDHLLIPPLAQAGWQCDTISWRDKTVDWNNYDLVMVRSPWDYQDDCEAFLQVLTTIDNSTAHLDNPLKIIAGNVNKKYLKALASQGVEIVPTLWFDDINESDFAHYYSQLNTHEIVIKPCVSACAFDTFRLTKTSITEKKLELLTTFQQREFMVQPFMQAIIDEGEFSLFYFDGELSHAILKVPQKGDYRVQEEYGSQLLKITPEPLLIKAAEQVLSVIGSSLLYARLDFVRTATGFAIMEAELIEPSLYFNLDEDSPQRFVDAIERRMHRLSL